MFPMNCFSFCLFNDKKKAFFVIEQRIAAIPEDVQTVVNEEQLGSFYRAYIPAFRMHKRTYLFVFFVVLAGAVGGLFGWLATGGLWFCVGFMVSLVMFVVICRARENPRL